MGVGLTGWLEASLDGELLCYPSAQYLPNAWKLAALPASGGPAMRILDLPGGANRVRWSPAGTSLLCLVTKNGATNIWEQSLMGGKPKQLTRFTSGRIFDFNWSSDSSTIVSNPR